MSPAEWAELRRLSDSMPGVDLAVVGPTPRAERSPVDVAPEPVSEAESSDQPLPETTEPSLETPVVSGFEAGTLDSPDAPVVNGEALDIASAPAAGGEPLPFPAAPAGESANLEIPLLSQPTGESLPTESPAIPDGEDLEQPAAPEAESADLPTGDVPQFGGEDLPAPAETSVASDTLEIPLVAESPGESLPAPTETSVAGGDASIPEPPQARISDELASPESPAAPAVNTLEVPVWNTMPEPSLGTERTRAFAEPRLETSASPEMRFGRLESPDEPPGPQGSFPTGYVPLEPGRSDLMVFDDSQLPPMQPESGLEDLVQTGFSTVRERLADELNRHLQEQAIMATMRESDFG